MAFASMFNAGACYGMGGCFNQSAGFGQPARFKQALYSPQPHGHSTPVAGAVNTGVPVPGRLFVTKVSPDVTQTDLQLYFSQFGELEDVYLPGGGTKGIAFISFQDPAACSVVLETPQHCVKPGQVVVVDQALDRPGLAQGKGGGGGGYTGPVGPVYGSVPGWSQAQMQPVAQHFSHFRQQSMPVHQPQQVATGGSGNTGVPVAGRLFVTKVSTDMTQTDLELYFSQFGELEDVYIPGGGKGIAFISFKEPAACATVLENSQHMVKPGQTVTVDQALDRPGSGKGGSKGQGKGAAAPGAFAYAGPPVHQQQPIASCGSGTPGAPVPGRLFVTKVAPDMTKTDLELYFSQFGELDDVYVPGGGKGIAFISFKDAAACAAVLESSQHTVKPGQAVTVDQALDRPGLGKGGSKGQGKGAAAAGSFGFAGYGAGVGTFGGARAQTGRMAPY